MEDVWINAIATLIGGALGGIPGYFGGRIVGQRQTHDKAEASLLQGSVSFHDELSSRFGWKAAQVICSTQIEADGRSHVRRCWRGITPTPGTTISHIGGTFWISTPGGRILNRPALTVGPPGFPKDVELVSLAHSDHESRYRVDVIGSLTNNDPPLDLDIEIDHEKGVLMTRREVEAAYNDDLFKRDYFCFDVESPIGELRLEVDIAEEVAVSLHPFVFFGDSEFPNNRELERVASGFNSQGHSASFAVTEPLVGLRYAIYWSLKK